MVKRHVRWVIVISVGLVSLSGCRTAAETDFPLDTAQLCIDSRNGIQRVTAERAVTPAQRHKGLMGRDSLPDNHGMLFVYEESRSAEATFWMYHTYIPLDIAYLDQDGEIRAIRKMLPCGAENPDQCPQYAAGVTHRMALEMPRGYFRDHQIKVGHRVDIRGSHEPGCGTPKT